MVSLRENYKNQHAIKVFLKLFTINFKHQHQHQHQHQHEHQAASASLWQKMNKTDTRNRQEKKIQI